MYAKIRVALGVCFSIYSQFVLVSVVDLYKYCVTSLKVKLI